jgi:hypothetical protein
MATVKILHPGGVGEWKQGSIVEDAPVGLVEIAKKGTRNAADGELLAEIVEEGGLDLEALRVKAKQIGIKGYQNMKVETLISAIEAAKSVQDPSGGDPAPTDSGNGAVNSDGVPTENSSGQ